MTQLVPLTDKILTNSFVDELPGDLSGNSFSRETPGACYSLTFPEPASSPQLLAWSHPLSDRLGLLMPQPMDASIQILAGNNLLPTMTPFSACYGGHQFGRWAGQLGDGRAINLCELEDVFGERWELQLKGAGRTPYSRFADGRAVLRSSLREFLGSEAMFHLGVPTTRALSLLSTGDMVTRDLMYDGNAKGEPGAIVARVAPSFIRFGHFEIHASRADVKTLKILLDWTIKKYFTHLKGEGEELYLEWFDDVCRKTAKLMVEWERVGFVHGVMNTDNMSILGLTIDYGPFGWMETVDPRWTPNTTDLPGRRYCFGQQVSIGQWNLQCLAMAIISLIKDPKKLIDIVEKYPTYYRAFWEPMMAQKIGFEQWNDETDRPLWKKLNQLLQQYPTDFTNFYRFFSDWDPTLPEGEKRDVQFGALMKSVRGPVTGAGEAELLKWLSDYRSRWGSEAKGDNSMRVLSRSQRMKKVNPKFVPRNHLLYRLIQDVEKGDLSSFDEFYKILQTPYEEHMGCERWMQPCPDDFKQTPGCSMLSCSS